MNRQSSKPRLTAASLISDLPIDSDTFAGLLTGGSRAIQCIQILTRDELGHDSKWSFVSMHDVIRLFVVFGSGREEITNLLGRILCFQERAIFLSLDPIVDR